MLALMTQSLMMNKIRRWWWTRSEAEQNFYLINSPIQFLLLLIPVAMNQVLTFSFILGWIALLFVVRWVIGALTLWFDTENEKPIKINGL